jgi:hypothetical protein
VTRGGEGAGAGGQRGSASLIGLALCAFVVIATLATVDVSALVIGRARAQTAADLAALAAVTPYPWLPPSTPAGEGPGAGSPSAHPASAASVAVASSGLQSPPDRATTIAASNGAQLITCTCGPLQATIAVTVRVLLVPFGTAVQVRGDARAVLPGTLDPSPAGGRSGSRDGPPGSHGA